jgi:hypothetical protein
MKVAIIVSAGRTGTQFLAHYFASNYPRVVARHEPRPRYLLRVLSNAYNAGRISRETLRAVLHWTRGRSMRALAADIYIESNAYLHGFVEVLDAAWDDPLVVHVVRDPRSYVRSVLNHGNARGLKRFANTWVPYWIPDVERELGLEARPGLVGVFAGQWRILNEVLRERGSRLPHYRLIHFEELFGATHSGLRSLCRELGLEFQDRGAVLPPTRRINVSRGDDIGDWRSWPPQWCRELDRICGPSLRSFGYGGEPEWQERVAAAS